MPSDKTESTELSMAFGILGIDKPIELTQEQIENYFQGTLSQEKFNNFKRNFSSENNLLDQMYSIGLSLRAIHTPFNKVDHLQWAGPQQQAATTAAAKDLLVANTPVSIKANSNVVHNLSPYNLFESLPKGLVKAQGSGNWFLTQAPTEYQKLYSFVINKGLDYYPEHVIEFESCIKRKDRKDIKEKIKTLNNDDKEEFNKLYIDLCHQVAISSAQIFNQNIATSLDGRSRNAVLEQIARNFFRTDAVDYILGGIDKNLAFAVIIPETTKWKKDWLITNIIAEPELERMQSRVRFTVSYKNRKTGKTYSAEFHSEIRWSHGKFQNNPEAKLYKNFAWEEIQFFKSLFGHEPFKRIKIIGTGSYGVVYEAFHRQRSEPVAIKTFQSDIGTRKEDLLRFEREVSIMSQLNHPNILPILDYDLTSKPCPWFATPLALASIAEIIDELPGDHYRIYNIYLQILSGIAYAHHQRIIHRDLKPQNILLFTNDNIMIGDFGLCKNLGDNLSAIVLTTTDDQLGTYAYAAPEQLTSAANVDHRADIYSLGKTLLHMLTGGDPPLFAEQHLSQISSSLKPFIEHSIQEEPKDRFQSVDEMIDDFKKLFNS